MTRICIAALASLFLVVACSDDPPGGGDVVDGDTSVTDDTAVTDDTSVTDDTAVTDDTSVTDDTGVPSDVLEDSEAPQDTLTDTVIADTIPADTTPPIPEPDVVASFGNCSAPGGSINIYDLQDPQCPDHVSPEPTQSPGFYVELSGVVVTGLFGDTLFVQEPGGGPYSGITVFAHGMPTDTDLAVGDRVNLTGGYTEFFENSQIYLQTYDKVSSGTPPAPYVPVHPAHISTDGAIAEMFEGVLVSVEDVETIHTRPDCPKEYGEFAITGNLRVDDLGYHWDARLGDHFDSITGPLYYAFGNFKIEPRDESDLAWTVKGASQGISKCIASECQAPATDAGTKVVVINEHMPDPWGSDLGQEWFELYNPGNSPVSVQGWQIRDCGDQAFTLSGPNLTIQPHSYLVLGMNSNFSTNGGVPVDLAYGQAFYLPNTVGAILLYDGAQFSSQLVDQIRYSRFEPWTQLFSGRSLERINPTGDGTVPTNWKAGTKTFGPDDQKGTPGAKNSATN
ncbi:MAG: hypothetical protein CVU56_17285 [Deltaproteobacteria bacterium HGW-Deltaproteobacteria-14]|nr:MAG: hypothetical protein CVU56_17285 [Deltaproteobacteria bacterium HGW-Deltaproteobacteria-14]